MSKKIFNKAAYQDVNEFVFGSAKHPVVLKNGMSIGGGIVYPEINFTLPPMSIEENTDQVQISV